jgi:hypothetical protein
LEQDKAADYAMQLKLAARANFVLASPPEYL